MRKTEEAQKDAAAGVCPKHVHLSSVVTAYEHCCQTPPGRYMYKNAGHLRKPTVFLFTEAEIKDEVGVGMHDLHVAPMRPWILAADLPGDGGSSLPKTTCRYFKFIVDLPKLTFQKFRFTVNDFFSCGRHPTGVCFSTYCYHTIPYHTYRTM